jgi:hypothetical protein
MNYLTSMFWFTCLPSLFSYKILIIYFKYKLMYCFQISLVWYGTSFKFLAITFVSHSHNQIWIVMVLFRIMKKVSLFRSAKEINRSVVIFFFLHLSLVLAKFFVISRYGKNESRCVVIFFFFVFAPLMMYVTNILILYFTI